MLSLKTWLIALIALGTMAGCDQPVRKSDLQEMSVRLGMVEAQLNDLRAKVQEVAARPVPAEPARWVLWRRQQEFCGNCAYAPARPISAYASRAECVIAASKLIPAGGKSLGNDPIEVLYGKERALYLHCLPPGVDAK
jgi:hypothetical protein